MLSGGERRRLALASLVASGANFLVLDEPTNHLDVESREALEEALDAYDGTILLVSHDRALIDAVATHTASIEDRRIVLRHGDYNDYLAAKAAASAPPPPAAKPAPRPAPKAAPAKAQQPHRKRPPQRVLRQISQVEARIEVLEQEQQRIEAELADPAVLGDAERVSAAGIRHRELQEELAWKLREWEQLQEQAATA